MAPTRAIVVSDDALTRSGLTALLNGQPDLAVVGAFAAAAGGAGAVPDREVALVDAGGSGVEAVRQLARAIPVVALVSDAAGGRAALAAGARGVLFRDASADQLAGALVAAARGLVVLEPALGAWIRPEGSAPAADGTGLTPRELEVLAELARGLPNRAIAQRLGIAERTAKFHVESILGKLGAETRSEAIVIAARSGMVSL